MVENIFPFEQKISAEQRAQLFAQQPMVIWFTGLSGSGKSTVAVRVEQELFLRGFKTYLLDGDNIRTGLNNDLGFDDASRKENIRRIAEVAKLMCDAGLVVLSSFISPFRAERALVKELVGAERFVEVFVDCPLEECEKRDVKGLYQKARAGKIPNFTGIDSPYELPLQPQVHIKTHQSTIDEAAAHVLHYIEPKITQHS
jgi:adenylylsulfate kinase